MKQAGFNVYHNFAVQSSAQAVFETFSQPELLEKWWPKTCSGETKIGCIYQLFFGEEYDWRAEVVKNEPFKSFHLKMLEADDDWTPTTFGIDIEERKNGVYLRFSHKDWPHCNDHFKHASFSWALLLNGFKNYIEKGEVIPFEERA